MMKDNNIEEKLSVIDIHESIIHSDMPKVLDIILIDRTKSTSKTKKNIIWGNANYVKYGISAYSPKAEIFPDLITGHMKHIIKPRALKSDELKKERTKLKAEVFTPTWVVKEQNDAIDMYYREDDIYTYINRKWLEVTCGEAPYMVTRYDMESGKVIPLEERQGFVDRKMKRINEEISDFEEWKELTVLAYQASFGYEWNGDSLLLARENLLYSYRDYYFSKWNLEPSKEEFANIATIISYNLFQMDGLKYIVPLSEKEEKSKIQQLSLFDFDYEEKEVSKTVTPGKKVKIMNWETNKMEVFEKGV